MKCKLASLFVVVASLCLFVLYPLSVCSAQLKVRVGVALVGALVSALVCAAVYLLLSERRAISNVAAFVTATGVQLAAAVLILTIPTIGALYWDTHHTLELTAMAIYSDWRSFLFEVTSAYILLFADHVYAVPIVGAMLCAIALSLPVLWARKPWRIALLAIVIGVSPYYLRQSTQFFTDSFFAAFTVFACHALLAFIRRSEARLGGTVAIGVSFVACAVFATFTRHNGLINAVVFLAALIVFPKRRMPSWGVAVCMLIALASTSAIKGSALYPEAHPDASTTNRNFQTVALLLNPWGALLTSQPAYRTPSRSFDEQVLSRFIDPKFVVAHYTPSSSIPLWEKFADPWRTIPDDQTKALVKLSAIRIFENLPIIVRDRFLMSSGAILHPQFTPDFDKICALSAPPACPTAGSKNEYYRNQVRGFTLDWPQWISRLAQRYDAAPGTSVVLLASIVWLFAGWLIKRSREAFLFSGLGLLNAAALVATIPTPEARYFFVLVALAAASFVSALASVKVRTAPPTN